MYPNAVQRGSGEETGQLPALPVRWESSVGPAGLPALLRCASLAGAVCARARVLSRRGPQGGAPGQGGAERLRAGRRPSPARRYTAQPSPAEPSRATAASGGERCPVPAAAGPGQPRYVPPSGVGEREAARPPPRRAAAGRRSPRRSARAIRETEAVRRPEMAIARQVLCLCAFLSLPLARSEPIRYSVAEEAASGSVVASVAEDAGLSPAQLAARGARLASEDGRQHFRLDPATGRLVVAERLDREELCGQSATCTLPFELLLANPLQFFRVEVAVEDINDHSPIFPEERVTIKIVERSDLGSRFPLEGARDLDVGSNSIQAYSISPENEYFSVSFASQSEDDKYVELVLEKALDREEEGEVVFSLIAMDGGSPPRSGTTQIRIVILDVNDNSPVFTQKLYVGQVLENAPVGSVVLRVVATDQDVGVNGDITYQFRQAVGQSNSAFMIDPTSGEIKVTKPLDFEVAENHELSVRATDGGGLSAICKVLVDVVDVNDNAPELVVNSFNSPLPENAFPGTVVALFTVRDRDSGANGKISCALEDQLLFSLRLPYKNYYELVTVSMLDREEMARHILIVTAADAGSPPLTTTQTFTVDISDVNDNAPAFNQTSYTMYVRENNVPMVLVGAVSAADADVGPNAKVSYFLAPSHPTEQPPCSCISVNSENGHVYVLRPLDYEQVKQIDVLVSASDAGSPPLSANVTVHLVVVDENDNVPLVLYPSQDSGPPSSELVPVSAEAGYLITKVVAVDADSGQNSWLSYHLLKATEPGLFVVGAQSGEVRLKRPVTERDAVKQKLVVVVRDNGKPPLSATAALNALLLNDFSDVRIPHSSLATEDESDSLTTYLIISLTFVSLLFLASMTAFITRKVCKRKELKAGHVLYGAGNLQSSLADAATAGTLPHGYCYEISLTTGSGNSEFKFLKPILPSLPPQQCTTVGDTHDEQVFPRGPITAADMAPDNPGTLSGEQFNSLSFN
ncbi:protocadherin beta-15-like [Larus michahellis]|uniref:protocadherin beta-15-like n=1 Tax=Larus michahellis TaxID=119627 RepID=UPI003D9B486D